MKHDRRPAFIVPSRRTALLGVIALLSNWTPLLAADEGQVAMRPIGLEPHPYTTEPGRFILEVTPISYEYDRRHTDRARRRVDAIRFGALLKYGVTTNLDLQAGVDFFVWEREHDRDAGEKDIRRGFGELTLRAKHNLWGNDGGETAMSVMPFLVLPTATGGVGESTVRGGLMIPTAWAPVDGLTLDWTPTFAAVARAEGSGHAFEFASQLALTAELIEGLEAVVEFASSVTSEHGEPWVGAVGLGLTIGLDDHTQIEPMVHFGVTRSAPDVAFALGLVRRF